MGLLFEGNNLLAKIKNGGGISHDGGTRERRCE